MAACNCATVVSLNWLGAPEVCAWAGVDSAPASEAPAPASAVSWMKSRRFTPSELARVDFCRDELLSSLSRNFSNAGLILSVLMHSSLVGRTFEVGGY